MARGPSIDWYKVGISATRLLLGVLLIYLGIITITDPGERTYNKYMHAVRKMQFPDSKPGDIAIAGLTADARNLCRYMRNETLNYWYMHDSQHPVSRLVAKVGKSKSRSLTLFSQSKENHEWRR